MQLENEELASGQGIGSDPNAQALWDEIEAEEAAGIKPAAAGQEPGTVKEPAGASQAADPAPAAGSESAPDPMDGVPSAVRDELFGIKELLQQLSGRVRNTEGHIGGLRTQLQRDLHAAAAAASRAGTDVPTQDQINAASKSPASLAKLVEDYPEFGGAVKEVFDAQAQEIASLRQALTAKPQASTDISAVQDRLIDLTIRTAHPSWKKEVTDPYFDVWVAKQPREVQALRNSDDPEDVIRLLDIRKAQREAQSIAERKQDQTTNQRRSHALRAAAIPAGRSAASITGKSVDDLSPEEFWAHLDKVEAATK